MGSLPRTRVTWRLLGVATAALLVASACSSSSASPTAGPITLNVLLMRRRPLYSASDMQAMDAAFTKANPNITINPELVAYDSLHDKIVTA